MNKIYESFITVNGEELNSECPDCEGDGHFLIDNTNASGGTMVPKLCHLCEGEGVITEDMIDRVEYDDEGFQYVVYKNN